MSRKTYARIARSERLRSRGKLRVVASDDGLLEGLRVSALSQHLRK